jgi:hypothetical protein
MKVVRGFKVGDRAILPDIAQFDAVDRVRAK